MSRSAVPLRPPRWSLILLIGVMMAQTALNLFWLPTSGQSGQLAVPYMLNRGLTLYDTAVENRAPASALILAAAYQLSPLSEVETLRLIDLAVTLALTMGVFAAAFQLTANALCAAAGIGFWFWFEPVYANLLFYFDTLIGGLLLSAALLWLALERRTHSRGAPHWIAPLLVGLVIGCAPLVKQHGWAVVGMGGLWMLAFGGWRRALIYTVGALVLPVAALVTAAAGGVLDQYLFWTWGSNLSSVRPGSPLTGEFVRKFGLTALFVPAFALLSLKQPKRRTWWLVILLWVGACATLIPNFGEIYVMAGLPLLAVMSGCAIGETARTIAHPPRTVDARDLTLMGIAFGIALLWGWTGIAAYVPNPVGRAAVLAYDEFRPVADRLTALRSPGDTLFMLPQFDGSSQLHLLTAMDPPGLWLNTHSWFLIAPGMIDRLLSAWAENPPDWIVYFPELIVQSQPYSDPLTTFMQAHYAPVETIPNIPYNGDAVIYQRVSEPLHGTLSNP